ncbi:MAG: acyl-CoA/acyl-ACP dehydrogenase [Acidimicrobiia bacterium]|nr:acyl-CoA/acyl-ACP dehydrogenase [Acidimicrobiia bacterium]
MDFELTDEQRALADGIRALCNDTLDPATLVALADGKPAAPRLWDDLVAMGVLGLVASEERGGLGLGWSEAALVAEVLGEYLAPGPILDAIVSAAVLDGVLDGSIRPALVDRSAAPAVLCHSRVVDQLVVVDQDGLWQVATSDVSLEEVEPATDPLTPVAVAASGWPQGTRIGDAADARAVWRGADLLRAASAVGIAEAATKRAVAFSLERQQFGRPVGSFQALKHMMADMAVRTELARASVYAAAVTLDQPEVGSAERAVAGARLVAVEAALRNSEANIQIHGGMGYTWEVDAHLFLKRALVLDATSGSASDAAEVVASHLG